MKKTFSIYIMFLLLLSCLLILPNKTPVFAVSVDKNAEYCFYTKNLSQSIENAKITQNGTMSIISCNARDVEKIKPQLVDIEGESICFLGTKNDALNFLGQYNHKVVFSEIVDDIVVIYAYSPQIDNYVFVNNEKVNLQLAFNNGKITVGTPMILGSF